MQAGSPFRLVYDIRFEIDGVPLRIALADPEYVENSYPGDVWLVSPRLIDQGSIDNNRLVTALSRISQGLIGNRAMPRQDYRVRVSVGQRRAVILVPPDKLGRIKNVRQGLAVSPHWDGNSFDFEGSHRLASLLADINDGMRGAANFVRSNGVMIIGFERVADFSM